MTKLRKYGGWANKGGDGFIRPHFLIRDDDERVTAYDSRDVDPLVEAAEMVSRILLGVAQDADGYCNVPTRQLRKLEAALAAFDQDGGQR